MRITSLLSGTVYLLVTGMMVGCIAFWPQKCFSHLPTAEEMEEFKVWIRERYWPPPETGLLAP